MSSNGKQSQRRNLHMDKPAPSASAQVHIFTKNPKAHILPSLQDQLAKKHHSFKLHNNPN